MLVKIGLLLLICEICVAGHWGHGGHGGHVDYGGYGGYGGHGGHGADYSISYSPGYYYQPQLYPSGSSSQNHQFPNAFAINSSPQFDQRRIPSQEIIQQNNGRNYHDNPQPYTYQQPKPYMYQQHQPYIHQQPQPYTYQPPQPFMHQRPQLERDQPPQPIMYLPPESDMDQPPESGMDQPPESDMDQPTQRPDDSAEKPTSTPLLAAFEAPSFFQGTALSSSNGVSEKKCYEIYFPEGGKAFVAGGELAGPGEFPHMAAIGYRQNNGAYDYQCGGSLISAQYILTAAHCRSVNGQIPAVARIGGARLDDTASENQPAEIENVIVHPDYRRREVYNDIALLKLKVASSKMPACLWIKDNIDYSTATAIGYGQMGFGLSTSTDLLKVDLQIFSTDVCQSYYAPRFRVQRGFIESQICAGDLSKVKDTCPGDSGGPLLARTMLNGTKVPFILGVTSFGPGCTQGIPGVYTRVSSYLDWIESVVWPQG